MWCPHADSHVTEDEIADIVGVAAKVEFQTDIFGSGLTNLSVNRNVGPFAARNLIIFLSDHITIGVENFSVFLIIPLIIFMNIRF